MTFCANCGNRLTEGARFCENCGAAVSGAARPTAPFNAAPAAVVPMRASAAFAGAPGATTAAVPEAGKPGGWLIPVGYVLALLGGLLGMIIGGVMWRSKDKQPNGEKLPRYDAASRRHGLIIFILSLVMIVIFKNLK